MGKCCFLSANGNDNDHDNAKVNNIIFTIKDTKLYVSVVTLSEIGDDQQLSKILSKRFKRSVY